MAKSTDSDPTPNGVEGSPREEVMADAVDTAQYKAKLTISQMGCNPAIVKETRQRTAIAHIMGIARGTKAVEDPLRGEIFIALTGEFEGVNLRTGQVYRSGVCYLPAGFHELVQKPLEELEASEDRSKFEKPYVEFSLQIDAEEAKNPAGYSYVAVSLQPASKADPLAALRARAGQHPAIAAARRLALPAPANAEPAAPANAEPAAA